MYLLCCYELRNTTVKPLKSFYILVIFFLYRPPPIIHSTTKVETHANRVTRNSRIIEDLNIKFS